jgi:hypothetical protein
MAHIAIDVVGDYALAHDSYDNLRHDSRELVSAVALILALLLAVRGLRICCEIATKNRTRILRPVLRLREAICFLLGTIGASAVLVPTMEWSDGQLAGVPVHRVTDAFGGSIALGAGMTILCTIGVALVVYAIARWLISHRDSIATIVETLLRRIAGAVRPSGLDLARQLVTPRRRRTPNALRLSKRGPPATTFA